VKEKERLVESLKDEHRHLSEQLNSLLDLSELKYVLEEGRITLYCRYCGRRGVSMRIPSLEATEEAMEKGLVKKGTCVFCGRWLTYSPWDIAWTIARLVWSTRIPQKLRNP